MKIETARLLITDFTPDMARAVHLGSLDEDTRRFVPDEVFETEEIARNVIVDLMEAAATPDGPFVHPMLRCGEYVGYVQLVPCGEGWEIGYHTVRSHTGQGYATEAVRAFLPVMMRKCGIDRVYGICCAENAASVRVLEKCGFRLIARGPGEYQGQRRDVVKMVFA